MGKIYWFTGQPGAGKTTLAKKVYNHILTNLYKVIHIDGDELREIFNNQNYSSDGRIKNVERAHDIAYFMSTKGFNVIVSLVSPFKEQRENFKKNPNFVEIYVHTSEIRGREKYHVSDYNPPSENFIDVNTTNKSEEQSFDELIKFIKI
jgi:adenylylsulfate kinase